MAVRVHVGPAYGLTAAGFAVLSRDLGHSTMW
jgi:hypothetical protein